MEENTTPTVLFLTFSGKRILTNIIDKNSKKLLKKCKSLYNTLVTLKPYNMAKLAQFKEKLAVYEGIIRTLISRGYKELVPSLKIKVPVLPKKQKYHHKQIEIVHREVISTEDLLAENKKLYERLMTIEIRDIYKGMPEFERYKVILRELKARGVKKFHMITCSKNSSAKHKNRIIHLLGFECEECGTTHNLTVHHEVPLSKGGDIDVLNLRDLCRDCHDTKHGIRRKNPLMVKIFKKSGIAVRA